MVDMQKLTHGVLHTKFWVVDQTHFYLGSANMDWRSLTQVCMYPAHIPCLFLNLPMNPCSSVLSCLVPAAARVPLGPVHLPGLHCTFLVCI